MVIAESRSGSAAAPAPSRPSLRLVPPPAAGWVPGGEVGPRLGRRPSVRPGGRPVASSGVADVRLVRGGGCWPARTAASLPPGQREEPLPLRLTRRGRRVVAALSVAIGLVVAAGTLAVVVDAEPALRLAGASTVVVQPGDTLWSIAGNVAPDEDRRAVVDAILDHNGLDDVVLQPGQVLELP
ncbi:MULTISPECIES: LysM peptidoglycan-binding domain-containing protein [unclassified Modestobacter]